MQGPGVFGITSSSCEEFLKVGFQRPCGFLELQQVLPSADCSIR